MHYNKIIVRCFGLQLYTNTLKAMREFNDTRDDRTLDEIWLVEHYPVFTQGQAGKNEHMLISGGVPLIQSDRGGQITYHGPGQQVMYVLLNLRRRKLYARELIILLEETVLDTLLEYDIDANLRANAPGVYVEEKKICSLGLRISKGCSLHGLALNINMDLTPFLRINPCGYSKIEMTQMCHWVKKSLTIEMIGQVLVAKFLAHLNNPPYEYIVT